MNGHPRDVLMLRILRQKSTEKKKKKGNKQKKERNIKKARTGDDGSDHRLESLRALKLSIPRNRSSGGVEASEAFLKMIRK